jgi:hypothetical protein
MGSMPAEWNVLFDKTLAEYLELYVRAHGDAAARAAILKDCEDDITNSPLHEEEDIKLPEHLRLVSISFH